MAYAELKSTSYEARWRVVSLIRKAEHFTDVYYINLNVCTADTGVPRNEPPACRRDSSGAGQMCRLNRLTDVAWGVLYVDRYVTPLFTTGLIPRIFAVSCCGTGSQGDAPGFSLHSKLHSTLIVSWMFAYYCSLVVFGWRVKYFDVVLEVWWRTV